MEIEQYLRELYYNIKSPVAYTGLAALWRQLKNDKKDKEITKDDLKNGLMNSILIHYINRTKDLLFIEKL